jgi:hypothetical protein
LGVLQQKPVLERLLDARQRGSKFYRLDLFLLRDHPMIWQDLHLARKLNENETLELPIVR